MGLSLNLCLAGKHWAREDGGTNRQFKLQFAPSIANSITTERQANEHAKLARMGHHAGGRFGFVESVFLCRSAPSCGAAAGVVQSGLWFCVVCAGFDADLGIFLM